MNIDTTIYGYIVDDCTIVCRHCAQQDEVTDPGTQVLNAYELAGWEDEQVTCERCGVTIWSSAPEEIYPEQVRSKVQDGLSYQFAAGYSWHSMIDDCDLTPAERAWAKEHLDYQVVILDK